MCSTGLHVSTLNTWKCQTQPGQRRCVISRLTAGPETMCYQQTYSWARDNVLSADLQLGHRCCVISRLTAGPKASSSGRQQPFRTYRSKSWCCTKALKKYTEYLWKQVPLENSRNWMGRVNQKARWIAEQPYTSNVVTIKTKKKWANIMAMCWK